MVLHDYVALAYFSSVTDCQFPAAFNTKDKCNYLYFPKSILLFKFSVAFYVLPLRILAPFSKSRELLSVCSFEAFSDFLKES